MELEGSCHCGAVRFRVSSGEPCPFNLCYCSICRKTAGGGGYGSRPHHRLSRASPRCRRQRHGESGTAPLLPYLRQRTVGLGPALAGAGAPLRLRHRHAAAPTAGAHPHDAGRQAGLGGVSARRTGSDVPRVSRRIAGGVAQAAGSVESASALQSWLHIRCSDGSECGISVSCCVPVARQIAAAPARTSRRTAATSGFQPPARASCGIEYERISATKSCSAWMPVASASRHQVLSSESSASAPALRLAQTPCRRCLNS